MIRYSHAEFLKNAISYQSYRKAQLEVNEYTEKNMLFELKQLQLDGEPLNTHAYGILTTLCESLVVEDIGGYLYDCIDSMKEVLEGVEDYLVDIVEVFHFGMLFDYALLFTKEEQAYWRGRVSQMFQTFDNDFCMNMYDFYNYYYVKRCDETGDNFYFLEREMRLSYVFYIDHKDGDPNLLVPNLFNRFSIFAREYRQFYQELIWEIKRRKVVITSA